MSEANLVIKLIEDAPNGYIPLDQLRKLYHEKYGKHLKRKKIRKWLGTLPVIYIGNSPVKDSISIRANNGLTHHIEADEEANLVIKLIQDAPNGYIPLDQLRKQYQEKYGKHMVRNKIRKWLGTLPGVYIGNSPVKDSVCIRAKNDAVSEANLVIKLIQDAPNGYVPLHKLRKQYHKKYSKQLERKKIRKWLATLPGVYLNNDPVEDSIRIGVQQRRKKKAKKHEVKLERSLPIRSDCYYGMANYQVDMESGKKCIMHFGFTSECTTKNWPGNKKKQLCRNYNVGPSSRAIVRGMKTMSGFIANKVKKAGGQKAARKARNLARLRKKHNPRPAYLTAHAKQRYRERGLDSSPIYQSLNKGKKAIVVTYVPIQRCDLSAARKSRRTQRRNYSDAKKSRRTIQREVDRMSRQSKKYDLPKSKLSSRDAYLFKLSSQAIKKEEQRRRSERKKRAYAKQCMWIPLGINTHVPQDIHIHDRRNNRRSGHKSAPGRSTKKKTQKRSKKKTSVPGRAFETR